MFTWFIGSLRFGTIFPGFRHTNVTSLRTDRSITFIGIVEIVCAGCLCCKAAKLNYTKENCINTIVTNQRKEKKTKSSLSFLKLYSHPHLLSHATLRTLLLSTDKFCRDKNTFYLKCQFLNTLTTFEKDSLHVEVISLRPTHCYTLNLIPFLSKLTIIPI